MPRRCDGTFLCPRQMRCWFFLTFCLGPPSQCWTNSGGSFQLTYYGYRLANTMTRKRVGRNTPINELHSFQPPATRRLQRSVSSFGQRNTSKRLRSQLSHTAPSPLFATMYGLTYTGSPAPENHRTHPRRPGVLLIEELG